ncbi:tRNA-guanine transglycosylase family protein [Peziza echinospora]|nr:tRNA-guanine transglycosylase family protein [Peziza echinospora]
MPPIDAMFSFQALPLAVTKESGPRLGRMVVNTSYSLDTPTFIAPTSRGTVPHLSHDTLRTHTPIKGVYVALEDFVEKNPGHIPVYTTPCTLRQFTSLPQSQFTVFAPRRAPPIAAPAPNSDDSISILTSVGFRHLKWADYTNAIRKLKPEIAVSMVDIPHNKPGKNRVPKMAARTELWLKELLGRNEDWVSGGGEAAGTSSGGRTPIFAPILPVDAEEQRLYLEFMEEKKDQISGLAVYDCKVFQQQISSEGIPKGLDDLPKLSLDSPKSPLEILEQIEAGIDLFNLHLVGDATDAGIALDFYFPSVDVGVHREEDASGEKRALGMDMWSGKFATDVAPFSYGLGGGERREEGQCTCYACAKHHRAYVQHLLMAKEMTAWVLLQIHNYTIINKFFTAVRNSISNGTYEQDKETFRASYAEKLPEKTGEGPRVRGYQFKSDANAKKRNLLAFKPGLSGVVAGGDKLAALEDAETPEKELDADELEEKGLAQRISEL